MTLRPCAKTGQSESRQALWHALDATWHRSPDAWQRWSTITLSPLPLASEWSLVPRMCERRVLTQYTWLRNSYTGLACWGFGRAGFPQRDDSRWTSDRWVGSLLLCTADVYTVPRYVAAHLLESTFDYLPGFRQHAQFDVRSRATGQSRGLNFYPGNTCISLHISCRTCRQVPASCRLLTPFRGARFCIGNSCYWWTMLWHVTVCMRMLSSPTTVAILKGRALRCSSLHERSFQASSGLV